MFWINYKMIDSTVFQRSVYAHINDSYCANRLVFLVLVYTVIFLVLNILIWVVNSNLGNAICIASIGLMLGPVFPATLTLANEVLPMDVRMVSMALMYVNLPFFRSYEAYSHLLSSAFAAVGAGKDPDSLTPP